MTSRGLDFHQTSISPKSFPISPIDFFESPKAVFFPPVDYHFESSSKSSIEALHKILKRLAGVELPGKEHVEAYLRYVCRRNRRPKTLASISISLVLFLGMIKEQGKTCIEEITKGDVDCVKKMPSCRVTRPKGELIFQKGGRHSTFLLKSDRQPLLFHVK